MLKRTLLLTGALLSVPFAGAQVKNPDTFVKAVAGDWTSFDPVACYDLVCGEILQNTLDTLFFYDGNSPSKLVPQLAAAIPTRQNGGISADGKTYTVKLRPGLKFSDGTLLTAQDVKYSIERMMVASSDSGAAVLINEPLLNLADNVSKDGKITFADIDKAVETRGNDTVIFHLAKPFAPFLNILATSFYGIYSKADAVKAGEWSGTAADWQKFNSPKDEDSKFLRRVPLGSGPFVLERYDVGKDVILKRNDAYWRKPAALSRVILQSVNDDSTRLQMLRTGDADAIDFTRAMVPQIAQMSGVKVTDNQPTLGLNGLFLNEQIDPNGTNYLGSGKLDGAGIPANFFSDLNVRRAFAYSFDYAALIGDVLQGKAVQINTAIIQGVPGYNPSAPKYKLDKALATTYFKAAWGGKLWQNGFTLPVIFNSGNTTRQKILEILKRNVESLNPKFKIDVREVPTSQLFKLRSGGQITAWVGNWTMDYADPHNLTFPFLDSNGTFGGQQHYKNPKLDALISQAVAETDLPARVKLYNTIQNTGFEDVAEIPLYQGVDVYAQRAWVKGRLMNPITAGDYFYVISKQ